MATTIEAPSRYPQPFKAADEVKFVFNSKPRLVTGVVISSEAIPATPRCRIQRICCAGFRNRSRSMNTTGSRTKPPRDNVSKIETMVGTNIKLCVNVPYQFLERISANIATNRKAIKKAAYVFAY
ncbi:hypothetical protein D3C75_695100 [compost metagenome]